MPFPSQITASCMVLAGGGTSREQVVTGGCLPVATLWPPKVYLDSTSMVQCGPDKSPDNLYHTV